MNEYISYNKLLKNGFSASLIKTLLPSPILKENPYNKNTFIRLYKQNDVNKAMLDERYIAHQSYRYKLTKSLKKARNNKKIAMYEELDNLVLKINCKKISEENIRKICLAKYADFTINKVIDDKLLEKFMVHYIFYYLTNFMDVYKMIPTYINKKKGYYYLKDKTLANISLVYPSLNASIANLKIKIEGNLNEA